MISNDHGHPRSVEVPRLWPKDTDVVFIDGKMKLMNQTPIVRTTINKAFDLLQASIVLENAFPDTLLTSKFIQAALTTASLLVPSAEDLHVRIMKDRDYFTKMSILVGLAVPPSKPTKINKYSPVHGLATFAQMSRSTVWQLSHRYLVSTHRQQLSSSLQTWNPTSTLSSQDVQIMRMCVVNKVLKSSLLIPTYRAMLLLVQKIAAKHTVALSSFQSSVLSIFMAIHHLLHSIRLSSHLVREPTEMLFGRFRRRWLRWYQPG